MDELLGTLGYTFNNSSLLYTALTHSSYANEAKDAEGVSNERLEFLGDSVLGFVVAERLYREYPDMPEGRMTRLRAELVCEHSLYKASLRMKLGEFIRLGRGEEHTGGRERPSILADAVEAVIAAVFLDGGMQAARRFVFEKVLPMDDLSAEVLSDYKTALQEFVQRSGAQQISYALVAESGPDHNKSFTSEVSLSDDVIGSGSGRTKKEAEQQAARCALEGFGE